MQNSRKVIGALRLLLIPPVILAVLLFIQGIVVGGLMWSYNDSLLGLASTAVIYWVFVLVLNSLSPHVAVTLMLTVAWLVFEFLLAYKSEGSMLTIMGTSVVHVVQLPVELAKAAGCAAGLWCAIATGRTQQTSNP